MNTGEGREWIVPPLIFERKQNKVAEINDPLIKALIDESFGPRGVQEPARTADGVEDVERRLHLLTLGVILDVFPSAERWSKLVGISQEWLFDSSEVAYKKSPEVLAAMQAGGIGGPKHNARVWWQVCRGIQGRFNGSLRDLIRANGDDAEAIQAYFNQSKTTFPVLSGPIISVRWLDLVHRIGDIPLKHWDGLKVPISAELKSTAEQAGIAGDEVHPQAAIALRWMRSVK